MKTPEEIGRAVLERLAARAAANRAAGDALRAEVRAAMNALPAERRTAKWVLKGITRRPLPSIRRVQEIMREARAASPTSR